MIATRSPVRARNRASVSNVQVPGFVRTPRDTPRRRVSLPGALGACPAETVPRLRPAGAAQRSARHQATQLTACEHSGGAHTTAASLTLHSTQWIQASCCQGGQCQRRRVNWKQPLTPALRLWLGCHCNSCRSQRVAVSATAASMWVQQPCRQWQLVRPARQWRCQQRQRGHLQRQAQTHQARMRQSAPSCSAVVSLGVGNCCWRPRSGAYYSGTVLATAACCVLASVSVLSKLNTNMRATFANTGRKPWLPRQRPPGVHCTRRRAKAAVCGRAARAAANMHMLDVFVDEWSLRPNDDALACHQTEACALLLLVRGGPPVLMWCLRFLMAELHTREA